ncbi:MAG: trehalose-phosphatase [Gemmatimonadota bacterium]
MMRLPEQPLARGEGARAAFRRLARAPRPVLFLDLDGTLAPLVRRPEQARIPGFARRQLIRLRRSGAAVVIVTGRSTLTAVRIAGLESFRDFSDPASLTEAIIGNHGADMLRSRQPEPWIVTRGASPARYRAGLEAAVLKWPGAWVEIKEHSLAVHYREVPRAEPFLFRDARSVMRGSRFEVRRGNCVLDVRARGVHKGAAVLHWLRLMEGGATPRDEVLYAGDDTTDEDAFRALGHSALTIAVGRRTRGARFRSRSPESFAHWLRRLADARRNCRPSAAEDKVRR